MQDGTDGNTLTWTDGAHSLIAFSLDVKNNFFSNTNAVVESIKSVPV